MKNKNPVKNTNPKWIWLIVSAFIFIILQLFWVLNSYYMLESKKILWWMLTYFSLPCLIGSFLILKKFNWLLFYSYLENYREENLRKPDRFRNKLTSYALIVLMASFFTYDTIIQTNDWFGSSKHERFNQVLKKVEAVQHGGSNRRRFIGGRGNTYETSDIYLFYKGKQAVISSDKVWHVGDTLDVTLNTGGFWGVLYAKRLY